MTNVSHVYRKIFGKKPEIKISYSQISNWIECPHLHYLISVAKKIPYISNEWTVTGTALHEASQWALLKNALGEPFEDKDVQEVYLKVIKRELDLAKSEGAELDPDLFLEKASNLKEMVLDFFHKFKKEYGDFELIDIEYEINTLVPFIEFEEFDVRFIGYIDIVIKCGDLYYLIDLKTTNKGWSSWVLENKKSKTFQLLTYMIFYSLLNDIPMSKLRASYMFFRHEDREIYSTDISYTEKDLTELQRAMKSLCYSAYISHKYPRVKGCKEEYCDCKKYYDSINKA
jgi:hypothetical protein